MLLCPVLVSSDLGQHKATRDTTFSRYDSWDTQESSDFGAQQRNTKKALLHDVQECEA
jgi:hypothetical protein